MIVYAPVGMPLDHPALEPLYAEAAELDLAVVLHTLTVMPPYAPGGLDTWDNLWLQRSAAHPWCGMRNMAAMIGSGVMDRYPTLRLGTLEAGHGWLPFWMARLDEHAETIRAALPELGHKPSEYVTGGLYFQSIEIPEGTRSERAHISRVTVKVDGEELKIYRRSVPYGNVQEQGLYFVAFSADPTRYHLMLGRMFGSSGDGVHDRLTDFSKPVSGGLYFAPSLNDLNELVGLPRARIPGP